MANGNENIIVSRALESGESTSEGKAAAASSKFGRLLTYIGLFTAGLPQILEAVNLLPDSVKNSSIGAIGLAIIGGVIGLSGVVKETLTKIAYIQGRSQVKAAAIRDVSLDTTTPVK